MHKKNTPDSENSSAVSSNIVHKKSNLYTMRKEKPIDRDNVKLTIHRGQHVEVLRRGLDSHFPPDWKFSLVLFFCCVGTLPVDCARCRWCVRVYVRLYVRELVRFVRWRRFDQFSSDRTKSVGELHSERFKLGGHSHCVTLTSLQLFNDSR